MKIRKYLLILIIALVAIPVVTGVVLAVSPFQPEADKYLDKICSRRKVEDIRAVLCSFRDRLNDLEANQNTGEEGKTVYAYAQVRGANWENSSVNEVIETPDHISINCPQACALWVNYDVDTRNTTGSTAQGGWFQHLYHIYVDGIDQAVFNQASMIVGNAAIPLAVNGVFPVSAGQHTVTIHAKTTGGIMQQFESHLQVMALEQ